MDAGSWGWLLDLLACLEHLGVRAFLVTAGVFAGAPPFQDRTEGARLPAMMSAEKTPPGSAS